MQPGQSQGQGSTLDSIMTTIAVVFFLGGFYLAGSLFMAGQAWYMRLAVVVVALLLSLGSLWLSSYRGKLLSMARGARVELRKVFWPSKDEAVKTTLMVLVIVAVFALFLSLIDWLLTLLVRAVL